MGFSNCINAKAVFRYQDIYNRRQEVKYSSPTSMMEELYGWKNSDSFRQTSVELVSKLRTEENFQMAQENRYYLLDILGMWQDLYKLAVPQCFPGLNMFNSGSSSEGFYRYGIDMDCMLVYDNVTAFEGEIPSAILEDPSETCFAVHTDDCPPGHCTIELIKTGIGFHTVDYAANECFVQHKGRTFLSSFQLKYYLSSMAKAGAKGKSPIFTPKGKDSHVSEHGWHGPAIDIRYPKDILTDQDVVYAIRMKHWPKQSLDWFKRVRRNNWPSDAMMSKVKGMSVLLVPAGQKGDTNEDLQWTFAFTLMERDFILNFNPTQRRCYTLLKRIAKLHITPIFDEDKISSYSLKTLLFWCIEDSPEDIWIPENLVACMNMCLQNLMLMLERNTCPQYFNPKKNLFRGKVSPDDNEFLIPILRDISENLPGILMSFRDIVPGFHSIEPMMIRMMLQGYRAYISDAFKNGVLNLDHFHGDVTVASVFEKHADLLRKIDRLPERATCARERQDVRSSVLSSLGLHLVALMKSSGDSSLVKDETLSWAREFLAVGSHCFSGASLVKLATYFWLNKSKEEFFVVTNKVLSGRTHYKGLAVPANCFDTRYVYNSTFDDDPGNSEPDERKKFAYTGNWLDVIYLPAEQAAVPDAVKIEMFKPFVKNRKISDYIANFSKRWAIIDSMVNAAFLQFIWARERGKKAAMRRALSALVFLCKDVRADSKTTSLNLLGYCCFKYGFKKKAVRIFDKSVKTEKKNAGYWHMAIFIFREIRSEWKRTK